MTAVYRSGATVVSRTWQGPERLTGTTSKVGSPNVPVRRSVRLHDQASGFALRQTWSDAVTGAYEFVGIRAGTYYVASFDHTRFHNGEITTDIVVPVP